MGFKDVFKKSFLEGFTSMDISAGRIMATFAVTCILACYVFLIYRLVTRKSFYSKGFNVSLAAMSVITAAIILAMQSNLVISLGMVGALSIVRFRTAIKDPMDLVFLFWSISIGIVCGAKLYALAILLSLVLTVLVFVLDLIPAAKSPMLLVMNGSDASVEAALQPILKQQAKAAHVKSRNLTTAGIDLIVELRPNDPPALVQACASLPGVQSVSLLDHDGQIRY